ncbi:MAG: lipocalin-like domain-containing protein [Deltaproteobacteria bacterium]
MMGKPRRWIAGTSFVVVAVFIVILSGAVDLWAEPSAGLRQQIEGNWTLASIYNEWPDGRKIEQFGPDPKGSMMLGPDGRFSIFFMKASLPKFASGNRLTGTDAENRAVIQGCIAYFGRYTVSDDNDGVVMLMLEGCTFPNWDGQKLKRLMSLNGDTLKVVTPSSGIGGTSHSVWKRVR